MTSRINEALRQALDEAIAGDGLEIVAHAPRDPTEWRRDWIRRIAMHLAAQTYCDGLTGAGRVQIAREATRAAAVFWGELEAYFAAEAEAEQGDEGDGR